MVAGDGRLTVAHSMRELGLTRPRSTLCSSGSPPRLRSATSTSRRTGWRRSSWRRCAATDSWSGRSWRRSCRPAPAARPPRAGTAPRALVPERPRRTGRARTPRRARARRAARHAGAASSGRCALRAWIERSGRVCSPRSRVGPARPPLPPPRDLSARLDGQRPQRTRSTGGARRSTPSSRTTRGSSSSAVARARYDSRLMVRWVALFVCTFLALAAARRVAQTPPPTIAPGVLIGHTTVGGMTGAEARAAVQAAFDVKMSFYFQDHAWAVKPAKFGAYPRLLKGRGCGACRERRGAGPPARLLPRRVGEELCRVPEPRLLPGAEARRST